MLIPFVWFEDQRLLIGRSLPDRWLHGRDGKIPCFNAWERCQAAISTRAAALQSEGHGIG
jgi:hypothetical protein